jgi:nicotinamide-nucleotide amidase
MNSEIIAVGSEMLTAQRVDTNSLYLAGELNKLGVEVVMKAVVGDDRERLTAAIRGAISRTEILLLSGGLGPTEDDLTREAVADALDRKLVFHPEIVTALQERFARLKRQMVDVNKRQAFVIAGAEILANDRGTAPGQWLEDSGRIVVLLPGPPHELKAMFERQVLPRLARRVPREAIRTLQMRVAGMPESDLDQLIAPVYKKFENPVTTILAAPGDIQIHLRARCGSGAEADALLAEVAGPIELLLGDRIYSRNGDPLEVVVGGLLGASHATLAVAESATGGMLGERITTVPGSSAYFAGGFIVYSNAMKTALLGVDAGLLREFGAVSKQAAAAMAVGARRHTNATHAIAITGNAGPEPGQGETAPVGMMYVGLADAAGTVVVQRQFIGDRTRARSYVTQLALDLLRRRLGGLPILTGG